MENGCERLGLMREGIFLTVPVVISMPDVCAAEESLLLCVLPGLGSRVVSRSWGGGAVVCVTLCIDLGGNLPCNPKQQTLNSKVRLGFLGLFFCLFVPVFFPLKLSQE